MKVYSPSMIAKGHQCSYSIDPHDFGWSPRGDDLIILDMRKPSDLGQFYHQLIELWLLEVNENSNFPINSKREFEPNFGDFFLSSRFIESKLKQKGYVVENGYTSAFKHFARDSKIATYLYEIAENYGIELMIVEEKIPKEISKIPSIKGNDNLKISGTPDCVLVCKGRTFVIDWKTRINDNQDHYYSIQLYLYKFLVESMLATSSLEGRIVSILDVEDGFPIIKYCDDLENEFQIDSSNLGELIIRNEKNAGIWCQNCKYNLRLGDGVCEERSQDHELIENKQRILDASFYPEYFFDVEFERNDLNFESKSIFSYSDGDQIILVDFHGKLQYIIDDGNRIRCNGIIKVQRNGNRVFHVANFVIL